MTPLVSIIVPCFNAAPWLRDTLWSALKQTWTDREIIVVDDGSTDSSLAIAREFENEANRLRVVAQSNRGASAARNRGLAESRGDYIQFLDADDLLAPDKIDRQMNAAGTAPPGSVFTCAWGRFTRNPSEAHFVDDLLWKDFEPTEYVLKKFESRSMMHPAAWLVPKTVADRAGPWNEALSLDDDGEYFTRVALASSGIVFVPGARTFYRSQLRRSLSRQRSERAWESQLNSLHLSFDHLLARRHDPAARKVAADTLKRATFDAFPHAAQLARQTLERVDALGGSICEYEAGPRFHLLQRVLGWRLAKRLRNRFG
jgi:glycosyltransferase involved in cell wall biosynthesis